MLQFFIFLLILLTPESNLPFLISLAFPSFCRQLCIHTPFLQWALTSLHNQFRSGPEES